MHFFAQYTPVTFGFFWEEDDVYQTNLETCCMCQAQNPENSDLRILFSGCYSFLFGCWYVPAVGVQQYRN